jgi:DNA-binding transcriptional MerR regulator
MEATGYTSREAAALFGFPPARVRALARAGVLSPARGPHREYRFSFQDLAFLRTARVLFDSPVPRRRVHRVLRLVVRQLPPGRRPCEVLLAPEGETVLARDGDLVWNPENGQYRLDFGGRPDGPVAALTPREVENAAEEWYQQGTDLEPFDREGARSCYRQAIMLAPAHAGAHVNLGRLLQCAGDLVEAVRHYRVALDADPCHATAAFNLGTALEALGLWEEAISAYRLTLSVDPARADAHYNLSRLYQQTGHKLAAMVHLKRYRELVTTGLPSPPPPT